MFDWILEIKHRKLLRMAKRELELRQVMCVHTYEHTGVKKIEYYTGVDVDWYNSYRAKCCKCGKVVKEDSLSNLKVECGLKLEESVE